ncbi:MAG TPA: HEAT repeat domain-containing protein [Pyrinomonadaceae bacterium]
MADNEQASVFGVFTTDTELTIKVWDDALVRFTGVPAEIACGQKIQQLFPEIETRGLLKKFQSVVNEGTVEVLAPAFHRYLIPCSPQTASKRFDHMLQRTTIAPVLEDDQVRGALVTIEDVTARIERERDLAELLNNPDAETRLRATESLAQQEEVENEVRLLDVIGDTDWRVRRAAVQGLAKRSAPEAIQALLKSVREDHGNLGVLNSALQVLAMVDVETLPSLIEFLNGPDPDLRMQAALAIGEQRDKRGVPPLLKAIQDENINVRFHAIEALGKLEDPAAATSLVAIAESGEFFLAFPALESLKAIGERSVAPRLLQLLSDEMLREAAAETLGALGDETVVGPVVELLNSGTTTAWPIAKALTSLYDRFEEEHGEGDYIADLTRQAIQPSGVQQLLSAISEGEADDLRPFAVVIGWLRGPAVDRTLVRLLGEPSVRSEVLEALIQHGEGVISLLIDQLSAEDIETRGAAITALGRLGYRKATPALAKALETDPLLRIEAATALARIGDEGALDSLLNLIGDPDGAVRQAVVGALNSIGSSRMAQLIKPLLRDERPLVRESAARIAGYFGYEDCADLLLECCNDEDERVRKAAVEHLPYLDDERVLQILENKLQRDTPRVRAAAASAFGKIDADDTKLRASLKDDDSWVRYFAAQSLGRLGHPESVSALSEVVRNDSFNHVRIAALEALGNIGGREAIEAITSQLRSADRDVARTAAKALDKTNTGG